MVFSERVSAQAFKLTLRAGAKFNDGAPVNSAAVKDPRLITAGADRFGSQCVVVAIDARRRQSAPGWEVVVGFVGAAGVIAFVLLARHRLVLALVSPDLARAAGVRVERLSLLYLLAFSFTVALGLRYLGVLLMGSLIIIPAATAKQVGRGLGAMLVVAVVVAVLSTLAGTVLARVLQRESGPIIIVVASAVFFLSLLGSRRR